VNFGVYFSYQLRPGGSIQWQEPYQDMLNAVPLAEQLGYEIVMQGSHHVQPDGICPSPLVALAAAAARSSRVKLVAGTLLVPLYSPLKLAEDIAVLDCLANGRFILGVSSGYVSDEFAAFGVPREERHSRMWEGLELMKLAWTRDRFSFEGKFYKVPDVSVTPKPVQKPHPPIWYGVSGPLALRRAARAGGTLLVSPRYTIGEIREHLTIYRTAAKEAGLTPQPPVIIRQMFVAKTRSAAEEIAGPAVTYLVRELYGARSAQNERELRSDSGQVITAKAEVDFERFRSRYVIGDPDDAYNELVKYRDDLGATDVVGVMHLPGIRGEDARGSMELFAKEVMPALQAGHQ
jgi:alkanesulfonate monooxygenase SsuD/methylene tetrahydromethanopterin reductase-like flavin-dependent oxidoreductase (luciferase family)